MLEMKIFNSYFTIGTLLYPETSLIKLEGVHQHMIITFNLKFSEMQLADD